jgi:hypothetical protein
MFLWQIYVSANNKIYVGLQKSAQWCNETMNVHMLMAFF